jgi:hypothetical protein
VPALSSRRWWRSQDVSSAKNYGFDITMIYVDKKAMRSSRFSPSRRAKNKPDNCALDAMPFTFILLDGPPENIQPSGAKNG